MPKKLRRKCFGGRQQHSELVHAGLLNAYHQDWRHACHASRLFGPCMSFTHQRQPTSSRRSAHRSAYRRPLVSWRRFVHDMHGPNNLSDTPSSTPRAPARVAAVGRGSIFHEASSASSLSDQRRRKPKQKWKVETWSKLEFGTKESSFLDILRASSPARPWDPEISAGPYKMSWVVYFRPILRCLQIYPRPTLLARYILRTVSAYILRTVSRR